MKLEEEKKMSKKQIPLVAVLQELEKAKAQCIKSDNMVPIQVMQDLGSNYYEVPTEVTEERLKQSVNKLF